MPVGNHADAPSQSLLDKQIHVRIGEKFERDIGGLEEGIPRTTRESVVMRRVKPIRSHSGTPKILEDVDQQHHVCLEVEVMEIS